MKITSLLENTSHRGDMLTEHGLSLYIETKAHKILFDMGQSDAFAKNAAALGIDLSEADFAVVSHGHYDHGGGLAKFLKINSRAPVYIMRDAFLPHYNAKEKYIGLDAPLASHPRLIFTDNINGKFSIADGITLFSCNALERPHAFPAFGLSEEAEGKRAPDKFLHEQYLQIESDGKRVLFSGCSHKGILNIMEWFSPDVLVGGFHFSKMPCGNELESSARSLGAYGTLYYTCHCTGSEQFDFMEKQMKNLRYLACGESYDII
jgi:7,8-dihydropterin-6-yl-methyl-4-(beta-D-ribofuranosyl)aminobenzene 5'-phosphate synthase